MRGSRTVVTFRIVRAHSPVVVTLTTDPKAIVVPSVAVQSGQQGTYVFVVKPDQTVEMRPVSVDRASGSETVLASGVQPGDTVVTDGHLRLVPGSRISVKGEGQQAGQSKGEDPQAGQRTGEIQRADQGKQDDRRVAP